MQINQPANLLPHRPPILMLDRVIELVPGSSGTGVRELKQGDPIFQGHFPERPILPGVILIEACAQTAMVILRAESLEGVEPEHPVSAQALGYLGKVNDFSFRKTLEPGQTAHFQVRITRRIGRLTIVDCRVLRDGELCAKGSLTLSMDSDAQ